LNARALADREPQHDPRNCSSDEIGHAEHHDDKPHEG
jgi:hypothetical protein